MGVDRLNDIEPQHHTIYIDPSIQVNDGGMGDYLKQISEIKENCTILDEMINQVQEYHDKSLNYNQNEAQQINVKKENLESEIKAIIQRIKQMLINTSLIKTSPEFQPIRDSQYSTIKIEFMRSIEKYQKIENKYRILYQEKLKTQYKIINPQLGEDELNAIIFDDNAGKIFADQMLTETRAQGVKKQYEAVYQRHLDVKNVVKNIEELNELFEELAYIIEEQNEALDMASNRAAQVGENLKNTNQVLENGINNAKAGKRNSAIFYGLIILAILVIFAIIAMVCKNIIGR